MGEVLGQLAYFENRLASKVRAKVRLCRENLQTVLASAVFRKPLLLVRDAQQQVDELADQLMEAIKELLVSARNRLHTGYEQIVEIEPHRLLARKIVDLNDLKNRATTAIKTIINSRQMQLTAAENRLAGMNPKSVLRRGYSITTAKKTGQLLRTPADIAIGDYLITELAEENLIESRVTKK